MNKSKLLSNTQYKLTRKDYSGNVHEQKSYREKDGFDEYLEGGKMEKWVILVIKFGGGDF